VAPPLFYLGTHETSWLARSHVPLFVSRRRLQERKGLPRARTHWALDSGGFTELGMYGAWTMSAKDYVAEVRRYKEEIGKLDWAAPQDWMCEREDPYDMLAKTGLTVKEHQRRTVDSVLELRALAPELPFIPVLQGWTISEYMACVELYDRAGIDLRNEPTVGVGTLCRREKTVRVAMLLRELCGMGIRVHAFGLKTEGLKLSASHIVSADSLAWSARARRGAQRGETIEGHTHKSCANCLEYAMNWRQRLLDSFQAV
jgi:hypothetical protein